MIAVGAHGAAPTDPSTACCTSRRSRWWGSRWRFPERYWHGNVVKTLELLEVMRAAGTPRLVFSSTAATYGEPESVPITEDSPTRPTNAYGATKLAIDHAITSYAHAHGLAATSLRYFNVAGAYAGLGERHAVETHLIPLVLQVATGQREEILVFGNDWPTPDGTAIRDYIHVRDLADAHLLALQNARPGEHRIYNLGNGTGFSVREVIACCREVTGQPIRRRDVERRRRRSGGADRLQREGRRRTRVAPAAAAASTRSSPTPGSSPARWGRWRARRGPGPMLRAGRVRMSWTYSGGAPATSAASAITPR